MILAPILFILVVAVVALWTGYRRVAVILLPIPVLSLLVLSAGPLPVRILEHLQNQPPLDHPVWGKDNVIVVIGIGTVRRGDVVKNHILGYSRVHEGARLFANCRAERRRCLMVTSGGDPLETGEAEARVMARDLVGLGVPASSILIEDQSRNTFANARFTKLALIGQRIDHLVLVTSGFHEKRARRYFEFFFASVTPAPADYVHVPSNFWPRASTLAFVDIAAHEFAGELHFDLYNYLGWNQR